MSENEKLSNWAAVCAVFGTVSQAEWRALSPVERDILGAQCREFLRESVAA